MFSPPPLHKRTASTTFPSTLSIALISPCFLAARAVSSFLKEQRVAKQDEELLPKAISFCCGEVHQAWQRQHGGDPSCAFCACSASGSPWDGLLKVCCSPAMAAALASGCITASHHKACPWQLSTAKTSLCTDNVANHPVNYTRVGSLRRKAAPAH